MLSVSTLLAVAEVVADQVILGAMDSRVVLGVVELPMAAQTVKAAQGRLDRAITEAAIVPQHTMDMAEAVLVALVVFLMEEQVPTRQSLEARYAMRAAAVETSMVQVLVVVVRDRLVAQLTELPIPAVVAVAAIPEVISQDREVQVYLWFHKIGRAHV